MMDRIWEYYGESARAAGRDSKGKSRPFSLESVFYNRDTLKDVRTQNELVRAFLGDESAELTVSTDDVSVERLAPFFSKVTPPYPEQVRAIQKALVSPVSLIQGPPGTGKTEMILNLISAIHNCYPEKTVAVVSSNAEAINNIIEKIRGGRDKDEMLAEIYEHFAVLGSRKVRSKWKEHLEKEHRSTDCFQDDSLRIDPDHLKDFPIFSSTIHSLRKIFSTKKGFDNQFDFVIADECSQVSIMLGLAAMSCAKQLVLIGDTNQLSPIIHDSAKRLNAEYDDIPEIYKEKDNKSFLSVCEEIFGGRENSCMLNRHFRCHPSIIGFCNEYVYDNKLQIMSKDDGEFHIRAVWYEGEYCENIKTPVPNDIDGKRNMRQIEIFMREEWPLLKNTISLDPDLSVCVISPFRVQLDILRKMLKEAGCEAMLETSGSDDTEPEHILKLTAHKAQGKGFDIVYMFTVEDYASGPKPWCQQKRLMNVAVSRAKREFCIITSAQWLPDELQKELLGYVLPLPELSCCDKDEMFYRKMLTYVAGHCPTPRGRFGLHRSSITSVFDKTPLYRQLYSTGRDCRDENSAPSHCMRDALVREFGDTYSIFYEVPLKCIAETEYADVTDEDMLDFRESSALDIVMCRGSEIMAIIEIDGAYHRIDEHQRECDEKKDSWLLDILDAGGRYLRFSTDGSSDSEMEIVERALHCSDSAPLTIKSEAAELCRSITDTVNKRDFLIRRLYDTISDCLERVREKTDSADISDETKKTLCSMNYQNADDISYDEELGRQFYLCRYGIAYAFEYALMYEIVMRSYIKKDGGAQSLGAFSFGCGSLPDAWAMAYSMNRLTAEDMSFGSCSLYYKGIDSASWTEKFIPEEENGSSCVSSSELFSNFRLFDSDIADFMDKRLRKNVYHNILMFPKILNELSGEYLEKMTDILGSCSFSFDEYYVCVSHSRSHLANGGAKAVERIINAVNRSNEFDVCSNIYEMMGVSSLRELKTWNSSADDELVDITSPEYFELFGGISSPLSCYAFRSSLIDGGREASEISELNPDFASENTEKYLKALALRLPEARVHQNVKVSQLVFQIVRLKRKNEV
ncbi:MAG: AAA domain-containing protein [Oscillospiraceae bacterium]